MGHIGVIRHRHKPQTAVEGVSALRGVGIEQVELVWRISQKMSHQQLPAALPP